MLFSITTIATIVGLASAAPVEVERRQAISVPQCSGAPPCVPAADGSCIINQQVTGGFAHEWKIGIEGDTLSNYGEGSNTLGGGLLDNLRGQCGVISGWKAETDGTNLAVQFSTTIFCGSDDVHNAIWLANGKHIEADCSYSDDKPGQAVGFGLSVALNTLFGILGGYKPGK